VLEYFDLAPTKVLCRVAPGQDRKQLVIEALPSWVEAMRAMAFWLDPRSWSPAGVGRVCKYVAKGFECAVPGVRRGAFRVSGDTRALVPVYPGHGDPWENRSRGLSSRGYGVLFDAEAEVLRCRNTPDDQFCDLGPGVVQVIRGRLAQVEAETIESSVKGTLGTGRDDHGDHGDFNYGDGGTKSYGYIRELFRRNVAVHLGDERRGVKPEPNEWFFDFKPFADQDRPGRFIASEAYLRELHDQAKFAKVAVAETAARADLVAKARDAADKAQRNACAVCDKDGATLLCSACKAVRYCSKECQLSHWGRADGHRKVCNSLAKPASR
jgi:hypothetical protein